MPRPRPPSPHFDALIKRARAYADDRKAVLDCPACGAPGLAIDDRSTPPAALWYAVSCGRCGLEETIFIPLGTPFNPG